ncbi:MAG TPA: alpha/beta hydrolase [Armatimonadota bacterium]|nr:alpha/beta hydrolase [Armatimonadota bacterium]
MQVRKHGCSGPLVLVLHGGPGAPGSAAALARGLADSFRVREPWQRGSSTTPLTVAQHVTDLHALIHSLDAPRPALVGHSWGAMLALAYAAAHPENACPLVLVGCGTFDKAARAQLQATLAARPSDALRQRLERLETEIPDPQARMAKWGELLDTLYTYAPLPAVPETEPHPPFDPRAHTETWNDMLRQQEAGLYPAAFAAIRSPVLMLHGAYDPHPGPMIRDGLLPYLPQLEYREWERCGHTPWNERYVRDEFFAVLRAWLGEKTGKICVRSMPRTR